MRQPRKTSTPAKTRPERDDPLWSALITTVVSSGLYGVEREALEAALAAGRRRAGWCELGTERELQQRHGLEPCKGGRNACLERNTRAADGSMVVTSGPLTETSSEEVSMALRCKKPFIHFRQEDLITHPGIASRQLKSWVLKRDVYWLHVTSPTLIPADEESADGQVVRSFLERSLRLPESVSEAAEMLCWELSPSMKEDLVRAPDDPFGPQSGLALYVRNAYGLFREGCAMSEGRRADEVSAEIVARAREMIARGEGH